MKRLISAVLCLVMLLGMVPAVAFLAVEASAAESVTYTIVQEKPVELAASDDGTKGAWYINGSTFVTTEGSANYCEIVESGHEDAGALHVYQDNVANNDMSLGVFLGGQAAGTYTLKLDVKGDLGLLNQTCKFYPYGCFDSVANIHTTLGTTDVSDWTTVTVENITVSSDFYYLIFSFSKYNWQTDMYIDHVQLLNESGVDVLSGAGNFCSVETVTCSSSETNHWPVTLDTQKLYDAYSALAGEWTPFSPYAAYQDTWPEWESGINYGEIVADGYKDAGSLHLVSAGSKNTGVVINAGLVSGETYTIGMWVKGTANSNKMLGLYGNGNTCLIGNPNYCGDVCLSSVPADWTYIEASFTADRSGLAILAADWGVTDIYIDNITLKDSSGTDLLSGYGDFYVVKEAEEEVGDKLDEIYASEPAEAYKWFNSNGFENNDTKTLEIVEDGADDMGSIHVYQPDGQTADADMRIGIRVDSIPAGTYTLQYKIKGTDLGNTDGNSNKFYLHGYSDLTNQFRVAAGTKTLSDWTAVEETVTTTGEVTYIYLMVSKYVNGADYYVDNVKLLDTSGNDLLQGAGSFYIAGQSEETNVTLDTIYDSNPGVNYKWFNGNGFTATSDMYMEIVEDGADDIGSVHVYQTDGAAAAADMNLYLYTDGIPAGTYTLQYNIKGTDLGNEDTANSCRFYLNKDPSVTTQFRILAGSKTVSDWTTLSETVTTTETSTHIVLGISKYVCGIDVYVDNVKLLDASGNDLLQGAGNFCIVSESESDTTEPDTTEPEETTEPTEPTEPEVEGLAVISSSAERAYRWYWNGMTYTQTDYSTLDVSGFGADDPGSLHFWQSTTGSSDINLCLINTMASDLDSGCYTLSLKVKGTFCNTEAFSIYPAYCDDTQIAALNIPKALIASGAATYTDGMYVVSDWTTLTFELPRNDGDNGFMYLALMFSKYNNTCEYYLDNVQVLDPNGNDMLGGAGSFMDSGSEYWPIILPDTGAEILNSNTMYYTASVAGGTVSVSNHVESGVTAGDQNFSVIYNGNTTAASNKNVTVDVASADGKSIVFAVSSNAGSIDFPSTDLQLMMRAGEFNLYDVVITEHSCSHSETTTTTVAATCTEDGSKTVTCNACGEVISTTTITATGHSHGDWVVTTPATLASAGVQTKTCSACGDEITEEIPCLAGDVEAWSLTLGSDLSVNFKISVHEDIRENAQIVISVAGEAYTYSAAENTYDDGYCYVSASVAAVQMTDEITVQIVNGSDASVTKTYTVVQYAQTVLADETLSQYHQLVKEMLNYGAAAQSYFSYNTGNPANAGITGAGESDVPETADQEMSVTGEIDGISFYAASLVYSNKVAVRLYFSGDVTDHTFSDGTNTYEPVLLDTYSYIEISGIDPQNWDDAVVITVDGALTVSYSPMNYIVRMNVKGSESLKALLKAMYNYHLAAEVLCPDAA